MNVFLKGLKEWSQRWITGPFCQIVGAMAEDYVKNDRSHNYESPIEDPVRDLPSLDDPKIQAMIRADQQRVERGEPYWTELIGKDVRKDDR